MNVEIIFKKQLETAPDSQYWFYILKDTDQSGIVCSVAKTEPFPNDLLLINNNNLLPVFTFKCQEK